MSFSGLFQTQGMLFLLLLIGYIFGKKGLADGTGKNLLTDLVIYVTLPGSIIKSFQIEFNHQILIACMTIAIAGIVIQTGSSVLGMFLYNHYGDSKKKVLQYATICSNAGILGNPIAEGIFGQMGMMYASIYVIPQRIFMWSVGLTYFTEASMHPVCIYRIFPDGNTDTAAGSTERDHKKYCRCKYISCNGTGGRDLIQGKNEGTGRS